MTTMRIVEDDDGNKRIERLTADGEWVTASAPRTGELFSVGDTRGLKYDALDSIVHDATHPQHELANRLSESAFANAKGLASGMIGQMQQRLQGKGITVTPEEVEAEKQKFTEMLRSRSAPASSTAIPKMSAIQPAPDPTWEVLAAIEKQNRILEEQRDDAHQEARRSARHTVWGLAAAWVAVGVTVAVGVIQIYQAGG